MSPARTATRTDELSIRAWASELEAAAQIARQIAPTPFLPPSLRRFHRDDHGRMLDGKDGRRYSLDLDATTATAAAAIMTGQELGLPPGAALRSIAVINDTPTLSALALRAVLQTQGHEIWVLPESNSTRAIVRAKRAGSDEIQTSTWTIDRARTLGLYPGTEKSNWRRQPTAMLIARATAEAARWVAADAILGIPLVAEELMDELDGGEGAPLAIEAGPAANGEQPKPRRAARRKPPGSPPALPTGPLPAPAEPPPAESTPKGPKLPKAMLDKIHAGLRDVGVGEDRDKALSMISGWAGARIESTATLTPDQAHAVLDGLDVLRQTARRLEAEAAQSAAEAPQPEPPGDEAS